MQNFVNYQRYFALILCLFNITCGGENLERDIDINDYVSLTFEFGDKNSDEYLLVRPGELQVDSHNQLYVLDENKIKIFTETGKEISILGGQGQGPGEFSNAGFKPTMSPTGYYSAINDNGFSATVYKNKMSLFRKNFNQYSFFDTYSRIMPGRIQIRKITFLGEDEFVVEINSGIKFNSELDETVLVLNRGNKFRELVNIKHRFIIFAGGSITTVPYRGTIIWDLIDSENLFYFHPQSNVSLQDGKYYYRVTFVSLNSAKETEITNSFVVNPIPDSLMTKYANKDDEASKAAYAELEKWPNYPPLRNICVDSNLVYVVTNGKREDKFITDIFDLESKEYLRTIYFSTVPDVIKNGKAYCRKTKKGSFPKIEIYEISTQATK